MRMSTKLLWLSACVCLQAQVLPVYAQNEAPSSWTSHWIWREVAASQVGSWRGASLFHKEFNAVGDVASAKLFTSGIGAYRNYVNGERLKQGSMLNPRVDAFPNELEYRVYDVTGKIHQGKNSLGIVLGPGWYRDVARGGHQSEPEKARVQLEIVYKDGRKQQVSSDASWITHEAAIRSSTLYGGETYDRREEIDAWRAVEFAPAADWKFAKDSGTMNQIKMVPATEASKLTVTTSAVAKEKKGQVIVLDAGKEIDGNLLFHLRGTSGGVVRVHYGNLLDKNGLPIPAKNHEVDQEDTFILAGNPDEAFSAAFTIHHFRYGALEMPPDSDVLSVDCLSYAK